MSACGDPANNRGGVDAGVFYAKQWCDMMLGAGMSGMWARLRADLNVKLRRGACTASRDSIRSRRSRGRGRLLEIPSAFLQVIERPPRGGA